MPAIEGRPTRIEQAPYIFTPYVLKLPADWKRNLEDVYTYDFWQHVHDKLKLFDTLLVIDMDGRFEVELRVIQIGPGTLQLRQLRLWTPKAGEAAMAPKVRKNHSFKTQIDSTTGLYKVIEKDTGKVIGDGYPKDDADREVERLETEREANDRPQLGKKAA